MGTELARARQTPPSERAPRLLNTCERELSAFSTAVFGLIEDLQKEDPDGTKLDWGKVFRDVSTDSIQFSFDHHENMEGSFYLTDKQTGASIRFRWAGTMNTLHVYLKDGKEKGAQERLFMYINRGAFDPSDLSYITRVDGKNIQALGVDGAQVAHFTDDGYERMRVANVAYYARERELNKLKKNPVTRLLNAGRIKDLEAEMKEHPKPEPKDFQTKEVVPLEQINTSLATMARMFSEIAASIQCHGSSGDTLPAK